MSIHSDLASTVQSGRGIVVLEILSWHTLGPLLPIKHHLNTTACLSHVAGHVELSINSVLMLLCLKWHPVTRTQSSRAPLACGGTGGSHHECVSVGTVLTHSTLPSFQPVCRHWRAGVVHFPLVMLETPGPSVPELCKSPQSFLWLSFLRNSWVLEHCIHSFSTLALVNATDCTDYAFVCISFFVMGKFSSLTLE